MVAGAIDPEFNNPTSTSNSSRNEIAKRNSGKFARSRWFTTANWIYPDVRLNAKNVNSSKNWDLRFKIKANQSNVITTCIDI